MADPEEDDDAMEVEAVVASSEDDEEDGGGIHAAAAVAAVQEDDDKGEEEEEMPAAAVVLADDDENEGDEEVVATVLPEAEALEEASPPDEVPEVAMAEAVAAPAPAAAPAKAPKKKKVVKKKSANDKKAATTSPKKKKKKAAGAATKASGKVTDVWPVSPARVALAKEARALLHETVQHLPVVLAETTVRSMGQIKLPATHSLAAKPTPFCTTAALYPVGFSCDRYEFSPIHGRLIQLRCTILDAARVRQLQKERHAEHLWPQTEGPIFRVLWGLGVDEDKWADDAQWAFAAAPPQGGPPKQPTLRPAVDQRVRVRLERKEYTTGVITAVRKAGKTFEIDIRYDDGAVEKAAPFPDPDMNLVAPGAEDEVDVNGNVELTELGGKPVQCALGKTPLEAWGKALTRLGLIDEIMYEKGLETVHKSRVDARKEIKEKMDSSKGKASRKSDVGDEKTRRGSISTNASAVEDDDSKKNEETDADGEDTRRDPPSEEEQQLRQKVKALEEELEEATAQSNEAAVALADTRISALGGPMLCNPFPRGSKSQQTNWMALAVRKEKLRMGSTGNRRKIVGAADLLERNDTFYNPDIEALIEGLPGSEYCPAYIFQAKRSGGSAAATNRQWIHEAQLRQEKEALRRSKLAKDAEARESLQRQKNKKRKKLQDIRDERKRQKMEEEEEKKKTRIEERLARLRVQVDERLFKEASFQRERVVTALARNLGKEYQRRRRAAEIVAAQAISEAKDDHTESAGGDSLSLVISESNRVYQEDVVRIWDFVSTFGSFFVERGYLTEVPTLDSLQNAIESLEKGSSGSHSREEALSTCKELAIALCKPLAISLTRVLFASLIALNPILQKDYGAAFFNEMSAGTGEDTKEFAEKAEVLLPVNDLTWREIARQSFVADAFGELGLQRHEVAHYLRGYRSAGHPNSKEAQRLRKSEGFSTSLVQQELTGDRPGALADTGFRLRLRTPCSVAFKPDDYRFFLHVANSLDDLAVTELRENLSKATELLMSTGSGKNDGGAPVLGSVNEMIELLEEIHHTVHPTKPETKILKKVRRLLRNLVNKVTTPVLAGTENGKWPWQQADENVSVSRERIGLISFLSLTKEEHKKFAAQREDYMEEALRMKEEAEGEQGNDDEDDDDDDDDNDQKAEVVANGEGEMTVSKDAEHGENVEVVTRLGKETPYDEYCGDIPDAPDLLRRCLAVLRTLAMTNAAEPFHYPVDPQLFPNYYDSVLRPMCLSEAGKKLKQAAMASKDATDADRIVEVAVLEFGRNIRLIGQNCIVYANAGPMVIAAGMELVRVFERLLLDWVLAPENLLPPLEQLDDDFCVDAHHSDDSATVLLCDGCEGKFNISRLKPPLKEVPKGDWYCPRCVSGRWWGDLDPRIGRSLSLTTDNGEKVEAVIEKCTFRFAGGDGCLPSLMYSLRLPDGKVDILPLESVDKIFSEIGKPMLPIRCLQAVAESPGYGFGVDHGLRQDLVPVLLNPRFSESAAQATLSSSVFRDTIAASATLLLVEPKDMAADEWLRLLVLLVMKCSSSEGLQNIISKMENDANESMAPRMEQLSKVAAITEVLPDIAPDKTIETVAEESETVIAMATAQSDNNEGQNEVVDVSADDAMVVDAGAVEIVDEMVTDETAPTVVSSSGTDAPKIVASTAVPEEPVKDPKADTLAARSKRQKAIEDSFAAHTIKNQLKPFVSSFEVDNVSTVVDATLSGTSRGLKFSVLRSRRKACDLCGLGDIALGLPLIRVPNAKEWNELIPHAARGRKTHLIAELPCPDTSLTPKLVSLKVKVEGEIVSEPEPLINDEDVGMADFPPRSEEGFQAFLQHCHQTGLPFVTGSLSSHECCANAAHKARKEQTIQKYKDQRAKFIEQEAGLTCGRCLEIGGDRLGRSFWKFHGDPKTLFVRSPASSGTKWYRFMGSEGVAAVIAAMKNESILPALQMYFPDANLLVKEGKFTDLLLRRKFPAIAAVLDDEEDNEFLEALSEPVLITVEGGFDPYDEGESVLVESPSGDSMWDATIVAVSHINNPEKKGCVIIDAYQVHYSGWSTRFVEWVAPNRVVEPSEHNRMFQQELKNEIAASRCGLPPSLNMLTAKDYLEAKDRARGNLALTDFGKIVSKGALSSEERKLAVMKAGLLALEAAVPVGSIHNTNSGTWRPEYARQWRRMVKEATGPGALTALAIYLEDMISEDWKKESVAHLLSCLPHRWKAIGEASADALAIRIVVLDRVIKFGTLDRKRYSKKKKR